MLKSKIKYIQTLGQKKFREAEGLFIAEGPKVVDDLIASVPSMIKEVYAVESWVKEHGDRVGAAMVETIEDWELEKVSQLATPNQVLAIVKQFNNSPSLISKGKLILALDTIQDPGNLGTIIRIADWFGVMQVICSEACADRYNPRVVQATMGSIARVDVLYTNLHQWLTDQDTRIYITALEGVDVRKMEPLKEGIIVIGNESKGVSAEILGLGGKKITIPRKGNAESLNAAVATGILLSHLT